MEGGYLLFRMPKRVISVRQKSAHLILHSRVLTKATRPRHSAFQRGCETQERHVTMRVNRRRLCHLGVRRDNGTVPSGDSAQPLWEAEFLLERALLPHVPSSICRIEGVARLIDKSLPGALGCGAGRSA